MFRLFLVFLFLAGCTTVSKNSINSYPYFNCYNERLDKRWNTHITATNDHQALVTLQEVKNNDGIISLDKVYESLYNIEFSRKEDGVIYLTLKDSQYNNLEYKNLSCTKE